MAVSGGVIERYKPGAPKVTFQCAAAVTEGRLVEITAAGKIQHAASKTRKAIGIAMQTGSAVDDRVAVQLFGDVYEMTAQGAIAAGDELVAGALGDGRVSTLPASATAGATAADINTAANETRAIIGIALEAIADTLKGDVMLVGA